MDSSWQVGSNDQVKPCEKETGREGLCDKAYRTVKLSDNAFPSPRQELGVLTSRTIGLCDQSTPHLWCCYD